MLGGLRQTMVSQATWQPTHRHCASCHLHNYKEHIHRLHSPDSCKQHIHGSDSCKQYIHGPDNCKQHVHGPDSYKQHIHCPDSYQQHIHSSDSLWNAVECCCETAPPVVFQESSISLPRCEGHGILKWVSVRVWLVIWLEILHSFKQHIHSSDSYRQHIHSPDIYKQHIHSWDSSKLRYINPRDSVSSYRSEQICFCLKIFYFSKNNLVVTVIVILNEVIVISRIIKVGVISQWTKTESWGL